MNFLFSKISGNTWIKEENPHITSPRKISIRNISDLFQDHVWFVNFIIDMEVIYNLQADDNFFANKNFKITITLLIKIYNDGEMTYFIANKSFKFIITNYYL
jgi:hypothetical protein